MRKIPIIINGRTFETKIALTGYCQKILHSNPFRVKLVPEVHTFLHELLKRHPEYHAKIGTGIDYFSIDYETKSGKNKNFIIHRTDGSATEFSIGKCINGTTSLKREVKQALRDAISDQIIAYKKKMLRDSPYCPISKLPLTRENCDVDHKRPNTFDNLSKQWLFLENLTIDKVEIEYGKDNQHGSKMANEAQKKSWMKYHKKNADLRLLSKGANRSDEKKKVRPDISQ